MLSCRGDLDKKLEDFEILQVSKYNGKNRVKDPMDDSFVPIIPYSELERVAEDFLKRNFPEALKIPPRGQPAVWVDPTRLAEALTLSIRSHRIKEDSSVFGQIYFEDADP